MLPGDLLRATRDADEHRQKSADVRGKLRDFVAKHRINYPIWLATESAVAAYEANGLPTNVIIDADGLVRRRFLGGRSAEVLLAMIEEVK